MKTITINLYSFEELSKEVQQKVLERLYDINVSYDWYEYEFEDAANVGLKLTEFNLDRANFCKGAFIQSAEATAEDIIENHGKDCETYKAAIEFQKAYNAIEIKVTDEYEKDGEFEDLKDEFLKTLLEEYLIILKKEYEYRTSKEAIIETINSNDYTFEANGTMRNA